MTIFLLRIEVWCIELHFSRYVHVYTKTRYLHACVYKNKVTKEEDSSLYKSLKEVCFFRLFILL